MNVHRMNEIVAGPDESKFHGLTYTHMNGVRCGISASVDGEEISQSAFHQHRRICESLAH